MIVSLGPIEDEKPVKVTIEIPAQLHRDLVRYAEILARENPEQTRLAPEKLIVPMLTKFIAGDRALAKGKTFGCPFPSRELITAACDPC